MGLLFLLLIHFQENNKKQNEFVLKYEHKINYY